MDLPSGTGTDQDVQKLYFKALLWATAGMAAIRFTGVGRTTHDPSPPLETDCFIDIMIVFDLLGETTDGQVRILSDWLKGRVPSIR